MMFDLKVKNESLQNPFAVLQIASDKIRYVWVTIGIIGVGNGWYYR